MDEIEVLLYSLPHYKKVIFALYCCNDVKHLMKPESVKCLELLEKWIEDNYSVSMEELRDASFSADANAAAAYAAAAAAAARAAARAAAIAYSADAAASAAAKAAAHAAARAAHNSNAKMKESKLVQYKTYLLKMIEELTPLEKKFI